MPSTTPDRQVLPSVMQTFRTRREIRPPSPSPMPAPTGASDTMPFYVDSSTYEPGPFRFWGAEPRHVIVHNANVPAEYAPVKPSPGSKLLPGHPLYKKEIKAGSLVRVVEKITHAVGWRNTWVREMDELVGDGRTYRVTFIGDSGVGLSGVRCKFPKESLQLVFDEDV